MKIKTGMITGGMVAGVIVSLPKGPTGFVVIYQTIAHGFSDGFKVALYCISITCFVSAVILFLPRFRATRVSFTKKTMVLIPGCCNRCVRWWMACVWGGSCTPETSPITTGKDRSIYFWFQRIFTHSSIKTFSLHRIAHARCDDRNRDCFSPG